jgi:lysyl endopeptidase
MKISIKLLLAACTLSILTACGNNTSNSADDATQKSAAIAATAASTYNQASSLSPLSADAYKPTPSVTPQDSPIKQRDVKAAPTATNIDLGAPISSLAAPTSSTDNSLGKPLQIGFGRDVAQTATANGTKQVLKWQTTTSGSQVAAINFSSTGAKGLRIGLLVTQLPASATLRFYAKGDATVHEVKGAEIANILAANLAAGDKTDAGRTYWGPVISGADATVEIELPAGVSTSAVDVSIPSVSHMFMSLKEGSAIAPLATYFWANDPRSLTCQVDVSCSATLPAASNSVLSLVFNKLDTVVVPNVMRTLICSGTLLNDSISSSAPYVLTANHCISDQTVASTLYSVSNYRSDSCNSLSGNYFPSSTTGSTLLYTAYNTDSSLLRLIGTPAAGVLFAGWDATTVPALNTTVLGVHHPSDDSQRLSRGTVTGYSTRNPTNPNSFPSATAATGTILDVNLTTGIVQGGSSGSGLFKGVDSNPQLIGQLFGGQDASCLTPTISKPQFTVYGRFDVAYNAGMSTWLSPTAPEPNPNRQPVYRFFNTQLNTYFYTISPAVRDFIFSTQSNVLVYEGISFYTSPTTAAGLSPVYQFYNTSNGSYFYTISEKERAAVATNTPRMRYDGVVLYASATAAAGTVPLYSSFNKTTGSQYFTTSLTVRSNLIAANPQFITDGIAFYVTP